MCPETEEVEYGQDAGYEKRQEEPVSTHPEDSPRVIVVPRRALIDGEKTPGVFVVSMHTVSLETRITGRALDSLLRHKDSHPCFLSCPPADILFPDHTEEHWAGTVHNCDIGKRPSAIVGLKAVDYTQEKRMLWDRAHGVVRDTRGRGFPQPGGVGE